MEWDSSEQLLAPSKDFITHTLSLCWFSERVSLCKHMLIFRILQAYFRITWQTSIVWVEPPMSRQQQIMSRHSLAFTLTLTMNVWLNFCCKTCWLSPPWPKGQMCGTADTASDTIVPCWNVWVKSQLPSFCSSFFNAHHLHGCPDGVMGTWLGLVQPQLLWENKEIEIFVSL